MHPCRGLPGDVLRDGRERLVHVREHRRPRARPGGGRRGGRDLQHVEDEVGGARRRRGAGHLADHVGQGPVEAAGGCARLKPTLR